MKTTRIYSAWVNGTPTQIKAYRKESAVKRFKELDSTVEADEVHWLKNAINSHQSPVDEI